MLTEGALFLDASMSSLVGGGTFALIKIDFNGKEIVGGISEEKRDEVVSGFIHKAD